MIQIYNIENTNFDQNGDMSLFPSSASVHAVLNGIWEVTLEHPKDSEDRWKYIKEGAVVKMPSFNGEQLFRITHKEKSDSGISADLQPIFMDAADDCFLLDVRPTDKTGQQALDIMTAPNKSIQPKQILHRLELHITKIKISSKQSMVMMRILLLRDGAVKSYMIITKR